MNNVGNFALWLKCRELETIKVIITSGCGNVETIKVTGCALWYMITVACHRYVWDGLKMDNYLEFRQEGFYFRYVSLSVNAPSWVVRI